MPFRRDVHRLPIFGLGCGGGVLGLSRAAACPTNPVPLALSGRRAVWNHVQGRISPRATSSRPPYSAMAQPRPLYRWIQQVSVLACWGEHCWPDSLDIMGWNIEEDGFGVQFSRDIPQLVRSQMREAADRFLEKSSLPFTRLDHFIFHPGGAKVLSALERLLIFHRRASNSPVTSYATTAICRLRPFFLSWSARWLSNRMGSVS